MRRLALAVAVAGLGAALAVAAVTRWGGGATAQDGRTLTGALTITGGVLADPADGSCGGAAEAADLVGGAQVVVRDSAGVIVGLGRIEPGLASVDGMPLTAPGGREAHDASRCETGFIIANLPDAPFYAVELGRAPDRAPWVYAHGELEAAGWRIEITLVDRP